MQPQQLFVHIKNMFKNNTMVLNKKNSNCKTCEIKIDTDATNIEPIQ